MNARGVAVVAATVFFVVAGAASAAVTAEFFVDTLSVSSDGGDAIAVTCSGGMAKVNGADPDGDPAPCGAVEFIEVAGGAGANAVDLTAVAAAAFPAVEDVSVVGDEGDDTISGSAFADDLEGETGDDTLRGNAGNDDLTGDDGDDRVLGGAGDDSIGAAFGNDALDGQAGSDTYRLDLAGLGSNVRVADTGSEGTDAIELNDCEGVTVEATRIASGTARVAVSGVESYPCGFTPPRTPPAPPPAARTRPCVVPRVRGRTLARAKALLARAHCSVGKVTRVRSRARRGVVVAQRPRAGVRRPRGARVALRVSRGP